MKEKRLKKINFFERICRNKAQSSLEYTIFIIILLAALLSVGSYFKRALQGRWKTTVDGLGDQYDPRYGEAFVEHRLLLNSDTTILAIQETTDGWWTSKEDMTNMIETKQGYIQAGAYVE